MTNNISLGIEFLLTSAVVISSAVFGYLFRRGDAADKRLDDRIGALDFAVTARFDVVEKDIVASRHEVRNELNKMVLAEEKRRTEAIANLEQRVSIQFDRVLSVMNTKHTDLKDDNRILREDLRQVDEFLRALAHKQL